MNNSQLIEVARALTKKEVRELRKWLASPAHNHRGDVIQLFEYLQQGNHLEDDKFLEKERVFKKIFPDECFDDALLRQTMHFLLKQIEEYLTYKISFSKKTQTALDLVNVYGNKGLYKSCNKLLNKIQKNLNKSKVKDENYYRKKYLFFEEEYNYLAETQDNNLDFQETVNNLETSFIIAKLRLTCHMVNHQNKIKKEYDYGFLELLLKYVKEKNLVKIPAINIYYHLLLSSKHPEEESHYFKFKKSIFNESDILSKNEMRENYLFALNYCIIKANKGKQKFLKEVFSLYKQGIENKVLFTDDGKLSYSTFRNTVNMGTVVKEFNWIKDFIDHYSKYLPAEQKEETVEFALGKYHFEKGEYEKARDHLMYINPSSVNLNLMIKSMLIRIYYSQDEFQLLDALLESMKVYINRKKNLAQQYRRPFLNLIKYTKKLVRVNPYDKEAKAKLRQEIEAANPLISKDWFLEQVDNL